ncbi:MULTISPECIES: Bug family tripartite tricarboxylate transporter substrate binding protein [unclassified Cupriavidus]|uniref:Bug family tripartite tricarboxylate transporter substrate binding protein n=1 Tax=unclassified Cupriavidus TaxID=2640874 RepID=UPI003F9102CB
MAFPTLKRCLVATSLALTVMPATAQSDFPTHPVKVIVSLPPGSGADTTARFISQHLGEKFKQPFVVENRPGANSFIGARAVAEAAPDGYTLFVGSNSSMVTNVAVFRTLPYDPVKDFVAVERIARFAMVVVVPANSPYKTLDNLVEAARKAPGKLNYASGSAGYQVAVELFHERFRMKGNPITYKGTAPAMTDVAAGNVDYSIGEISAVLPLIRGGRLRALAVTDTQRLKELPQVPTVAESGAPGFEVFAWTGVFAPAKVPEKIVKALSDAVRETMQQRDSVKFIENLGGSVYSGGPQQLRQFQLAEIQRTREIVKTAGIPVE